MALDQELAVYRRNLKDWSRDHTGEFVLIKDEEVHGFYANYGDALEAGYEKFGLVSFFVKEVTAIAKADSVTRFVALCPSSLAR